MIAVWQAIRCWFNEILDGWNRFWFNPTDPATLSLIRILGGLMLFYTHLVWSIDLEAFMGQGGWISADLVQQEWAEQAEQQQQGVYYWSHLLWIESPTTLWIVHIGALVVLFMLVVGFFSRTSAVLAFLITVSYMHRATGALFGLDQINVMLAMYLMVGPCGARYSIDSWLARRKAGSSAEKAADSVAGNIAIRLIQVHMCVIYFFAGTRKLMGETWWDGSAMWFSAANYEYQSVDMTWLANWPITIAMLTHLTILFEVFYCVLIWNRITRPVMLTLAVVLHLGIAMFMGMATFGLAMLIGNLAFISPQLVRTVVERRHVTAARAGQSTASNTGN